MWHLQTLLLLATARSVLTLSDGFTRPVMGYNTYNDVNCFPNSTYVHATITAMAQQGWVGLGYGIFMIDCGWFAEDRAANGSITYNPDIFPDGIAPLSKYAISLGMQWGMYTGATPYQCMTPPSQDYSGSQGHEMDDALQFAGWNTVYVKADNCYGDDSTLVQRYTNMSNALQAVGIKGLLACEWGEPATVNNELVGPAVFTQPITTSYRVGADIATGWDNIFRLTNEAIYIILNGHSGPGNVGDMDLLEVGNAGMTQAEQQTHFSIWAMFKSALIISTNVINMSSDTASILSNKDLIAINQDSLGAPVKLVQRYPNYDIYSGPLANGDVAVLLVDQSGNGGTLSVNFMQLGISQATVTDLYTGAVSSRQSQWSADVDGHGSIALRLSDVTQSNAAQPQYQNVIDGSTGTYGNGAISQPCTTCASGECAAYIGGGQSDGGGSVTYSNIQTSQATQNVLIDYINCEIVYPGGDGPNARGAQISVNGGTPVEILFPVSGYNWDADQMYAFPVELSGFDTSGSNTITITGVPGGVSGTSGYAPNIAGLHIVQ